MDDKIRRNLNVSRRMQYSHRCGEVKISFLVYPHPLHCLPLTVAKSACNGCTRLYSLNIDGPVSAFLPLYILVNTNTIHLSASAPRWILEPTHARELFGGAKIFLISRSKNVQFD